MRQLKITRQLTPDQQADYAQALPLLRSLSEAYPLPCREAEAKAHFSCLVSIAKQYRGQGASWAELLAAGHAALAGHLTHYADRPAEADRFLAWAVRQGILRALSKE